MEEKKKTAEQKAQEHTGESLMDLIVAKTFTRHSNLNETDFLKEIGFDGSGKTEEEALRIAIMNVLVETTKQMLAAENSFNMASGLLKTILVDEEIVEKEIKSDKKGEK